MHSKMKTAQHYSHCYALNLSRIPVKNSDRISLRILYPGIVFGLLLLALGLFDWTCSIFFSKSSSPDFGAEYYESWFSPAIFDFVLICLGSGIVFQLFATYLCYRKIFFDGQNITIIDRRLGGKKITYKEDIHNYEGVQLRIEFFQFGLWNRNRYIIELRHKNIHKIAPLYISTSEKGIRKIWKDYAKALNLPAIILREGALQKFDIEDLDKSLKTMAAQGKIHLDFDKSMPIPEPIELVCKRDKKVVKMMKICWDFYNFIMALALLFVALGILVLFSREIIPLWSVLVAALFWCWGIILLFRRDKIAVKEKKLVLVHKFPLKNFKNDEILKDDIEAVEVEENPATGRHYLAIYSNSKNIIFGKKIPINALEWVRNFLLKEIVK